MAKLKVYSKKTCVTCQKALAYLDKQKVDYELINIEQTPPDAKTLAGLLKTTDLKATVNTRSTAYKALGGTLPASDKLLAAMQKDPNLIKRPVLLQANGKAIQGFDEAAYKVFLK